MATIWLDDNLFSRHFFMTEADALETTVATVAMDHVIHVIK